MPITLINHTGNMAIRKHVDLPLLLTGEFNFYRCVEFKVDMYNKTISTLHAGNLRLSRTDNRYANLFPGQKLSYWADSPRTARAEVKKWGASNNILTFWAYDDGSSFIPTVYPRKEIQIIDGTQLEFNKILKKLDKDEILSKSERELVDMIAYQEPDCLVYESEARKGRLNYLFFEHGFKKLSLREVRLRLGEQKGKNQQRIICAHSGDYAPILDSYGYTLMPIAKIKKDKDYINTDEYKLRVEVYIDSAKRIAEK